MSRWVEGLEERARTLLPAPVHTYFRQGSGAGVSAAEAEPAWRELRFAPHVLRDVSVVDTATAVLGTAVSCPIGIAPTTLQRQAHPEGEVEMARGAAAAGALLCVSSNAGSTFAEIAAAGAPWWIQAYLVKDRGLTRAMLRRGVEAGASAVVLTADTPVVGSKEEGPTSVWDLVPADHLHANSDVARVPAGGATKARDLTPDVIGWLAEESGLPVVVKGVLRPDDAREAVAAGAAGVWVSNHGGRQLDRSVATARVLGSIAQSVSGQAAVLVDGGIRHGLDVLAALALGATCVFVARPAIWALTVDGGSGVARLLTDLADELREGMCLAGVTDVTAIASAEILA